MEKQGKRAQGKQVREEEIVAAAERIFGLKGFEEASMNEIAGEARTTKRTLYFYFANKEDLYFAVVLKGYKKLSSYMAAADENERTGFEKILGTSRRLIQFYDKNPDFFRIINFMGHVRKRASEESKRQRELLQLNNQMFYSLAMLVEEGKKDGSIRDDLDAQKTAFSLVFVITGFFNQLSTTGSSFTEHFGLSIPDFSTFTMDLMLGTLKERR